MKTLSNGILEIEVSELGAELQSIYKITSNKEYLWQGDPIIWNKRSPLLFPIVGNVHNQSIQLNQTVYPIMKHGFATDLVFQSRVEDRLLHLTTTDTQETLSHYPFHFILEVIYKLSRNTLTITYRVTNKDEKIMPFQIGGHPGFILPHYDAKDKIHGYLSFNVDNELVSDIIEGSFRSNEKKKYPFENGLLPITNDLFEYDTIVESRGCVERTTLYDKYKNPLLTVKAKAPVTAYWSPVEKDAPFICIEPWQGCCEDVDFSGEMYDRKFMNILQPGETFESTIQIIIE